MQSRQSSKQIEPPSAGSTLASREGTSPTLPGGLAKLEAVLERVTYANEETGYTVARVSTRGHNEHVSQGQDLLTVVGNLLGIQPGESVRFEGRWKSHPQYGRQFEVQHFTTVLP